jgi:hypothetical protein
VPSPLQNHKRIEALYSLSTFCGDRIFFYLRGYYVNIIPSNRAYVTELSIINTFETFADAMVSDPNSHLDLRQNESPVKPYKVEGRSSYFINTNPNTSI